MANYLPPVSLDLLNGNQHCQRSNWESLDLLGPPLAWSSLVDGNWKLQALTKTFTDQKKKKSTFLWIHKYIICSNIYSTVQIHKHVTRILQKYKLEGSNVYLISAQVYKVKLKWIVLTLQKHQMNELCYNSLHKIIYNIFLTLQNKRQLNQDLKNVVLPSLVTPPHPIF